MFFHGDAKAKLDRSSDSCSSYEILGDTMIFFLVYRILSTVVFTLTRRRTGRTSSVTFAFII
jgi:hypothetical protein